MLHEKIRGAYSRRVVCPSVSQSDSPFVSSYIPNPYSVNNFFTWCRILKLFHRNDLQIETTCRMQHIDCYLEVQGHSMTLQQNRVQTITTLFEVGFYNYFT